MNIWHQLSIARRIAAEIQIKYCGRHYCGHGEIAIDHIDHIERHIEDEMIDYLWNHPESDEDMWLNVHWDDFDCVCWVQIGVGNQLVPR